jgi:hypothetical protein
VDAGKKIKKSMGKKVYFRRAAAIARIPITVVPVVTNGDRGAWVAAGRAGVVVPFQTREI